MVITFVVSVFSLKEFKRFLNDSRGGLVLSFDDIEFLDKDWLEYRLLKVDNTVKSVNSQDLPDDFCMEACKLVDEFHRKTINENVEWMLYFDYTTGEVVYCWKGNGYETGGQYDNVHFKDRCIASLHNHPNNVYSFPSLENFDILENDFEDYEIICANFSLWIIECKGILEKEDVEEIRYNFYQKFNEITRKVFHDSKEDNIDRVIDEIFSIYLGNYLNSSFNNIVIDKKEFS